METILMNNLKNRIKIWERSVLLTEIINIIRNEMHVQISNKDWLITQFIEQIRGHISNNVQNIVKNTWTLQNPVIQRKIKGKWRLCRRKILLRRQISIVLHNADGSSYRMLWWGKAIESIPGVLHSFSTLGKSLCVFITL